MASLTSEHSSERLADCCAQRCIAQWMSVATAKKSRTSAAQQSLPQIPRTSEARQAASIQDAPIQLDIHGSNTARSDTVLYLGYASNMSVETFRGRRNIKPLSQVNVVVPSLSLTFDLPGIPYSEPCFGNVRYREISAHDSSGTEEKASSTLQEQDYHKDQWKKGLVGVVYEVSQSDFAHIIATEGGGASYKDVLVDCYSLSGDPNDEVPAVPSNRAFKAHTLFSPSSVLRPVQSYAQPSARYLKLITDGADELRLPLEYQAFLNNIRPYQMTTTRQRLGQFIFVSLWTPIFLFLFGGAAVFLDKNGRYPVWYAKLAMAAFAACWGSYDDVFKPAFGDGERTRKKTDDEESFEQGEDEKIGLLRNAEIGYGALSANMAHTHCAGN